ncbi:MAG: homocysteine S-methyltransferase family protein [Pseudonocardiaceae bacterium]
MARYRESLPQLAGEVFLTDSGLETTLIFHDGYDLPCFAAITLLGTEAGRRRLGRYFLDHLQVAAQANVGFILESVTWRASPDWAAQLGYSAAALAEANRAAISMLVELRSQVNGSTRPVVISGLVGPRGDGYDGTALMSAAQARDYHAVQIHTFADTEADMVNAMTITYPDEAIGIIITARDAGLPAAVSFTVETDGALPDGTSLGEVIHRVDDATAYYAINCAHPTHFTDVLDPAADWTRRLRGPRASASRKSHTELDQADELDAGDPVELAEQYARLRATHPSLTVLGGCCGTDLRHIQALAHRLQHPGPT